MLFLILFLFHPYAVPFILVQVLKLNTSHQKPLSLWKVIRKLKGTSLLRATREREERSHNISARFQEGAVIASWIP